MPRFVLAASLTVLLACGDARPRDLTTPIGHPAPDAARWPRLVASANGTLLMSWMEPTPDSGWRVLFSSRAVGSGRWTTPRVVTQGRDLLANWADAPSVLPLGNGVLAAQWPVRDARIRFGYAPRVAVSRDGGATWGAAVNPVRSDVAAEYAFAALFAVGPDSVGVAWLDGRANQGGEGGEYALHATTLSYDGALGAAAVLDDRTCSCCPVDAVPTRRGTLVSYRDRATGEVRDIGVVRRHGAGTWSAPTSVHGDRWRIPGCPVNGADLAARGDTVAAAWFTAAADSARVRFAWSRDSGEEWEAPVTLDGEAPIGRVAVALDARGEALALWMARGDSSRAVLRLARVSRTGRAQRLADIASVSGGRATGFPQLAVSGDTAFVAWTTSGADDRPSGIVLRRVPLGR